MVAKLQEMAWLDEIWDMEHHGTVVSDVFF